MAEQCEAVTHHGSRNPDSANFGPDEYCENDALPEEEYCAEHIESDPWYDGPEYAYDDENWK